MKKNHIKIGSRGSKLAIIYAEKVKSEISKFYSGKIEIRKIITTGDQNQNENSKKCYIINSLFVFNEFIPSNIFSRR